MGEPMNKQSTVTAKRVIITYTPYGADKEHYSAATVEGISGDRVFLDTIWGRHAFSRADGRWIDGPCLNFADGKIHQFDELERSIQSGTWNAWMEVPAEKSAPFHA